MNLKKMFSPRTIRKKIILTSKLAGVLLIASYLFSTHISDDPDISLLVWLGFVIPLILAVDFLMGRFISDPISRLNAAAGRLAHLDFSEPCRLTSEDEFGELSHSLRQMSENLQDTLARLELTNSQLSSILDGGFVRRPHVGTAAHFHSHCFLSETQFPHLNNEPRVPVSFELFVL